MADTKNSMYLCTEMGCNRKYKTKDKLIAHILKDHQKIISESDIQDPVAITKENKEKVNKVKDQEILKHKALQKAKEEQELKEEARRQQLERLTTIENKKLENQEKQLAIESKFVQLLEKIAANMEKDGEECSVCCERKRDAVINNCGHTGLCYPCALNYKENFSNRGCPFCRQAMTSVVKIYLS